jgi:hypothetical protein
MVFPASVAETNAMQRHNGLQVFLGILISLVVIAAHGAQPSSAPMPTSQTYAVKDTYNNRAFEYQSRLLARRDGFCVYRWTYPSPVATSVEQNNTIRADFYLPDDIRPGDCKRPAIIVLHVLDGDMRLTDVACSVLARRGVPAVMPVLPYYGERAKAEGWKALLRDPNLFLDMAYQSAEDIRRTLDVLVSRPEIDAHRIDITGVSLGGILGASAASMDPRFHRVVLLLAGGDLMTILNGAHDTLGLNAMLFRDVPRFQDWLQKFPPDRQAAIVARILAFDPLTLAPALRQRAQLGQVLMINVIGDEVIPNTCTRKLAAALGISDQVVWLYGQEHETFTVPEALCKMVEFVAQDLPPGVKVGRPAVDDSTPANRAAALLHQVRTLLTTEPDPGHCHRLEIEISVQTKEKTPIETRIRLARGANDKFAVTCRLPLLGDVAFGQGAFPWMVGIGKTVIAGVDKPSKNHSPLSLADPRKIAALRAWAGLSATLDMIRLDTLHYWIDIQDAVVSKGRPALRIAVNEKYPGSIWLCFQKDGKTPAKAVFDMAGVSGQITIRRWQINAIAEETLFNPPADLPVTRVEQADLYRAFATLLDLAMPPPSSEVRLRRMDESQKH